MTKVKTRTSRRDDATMCIWMAALVAAALLLSAPARAAVAEDESAKDAEHSLTVTRGMSCLAGGAIAGAWVMAAPGSAVAVAAAGAVTVLPVIATAVVAGCGAGAVLSPAFWWLSHQWKGHNAAGREPPPPESARRVPDKSLPLVRPEGEPRLERLQLSADPPLRGNGVVRAVNRVVARGFSRR